MACSMLLVTMFAAMQCSVTGTVLTMSQVLAQKPIVASGF